MRRVSVLAAAALGVLVIGSIGVANGAVPSIWSQTPDMAAGLAFSSEEKVPSIVADNWTCPDQNLTISTIKWWGAYWTPYVAGGYSANSDSLPNGAAGSVTGFTISIWTDVPANTGGIPFARPGTKVWDYNTSSFSESSYGATTKGRNVYQYSVDIPELSRFVHTQGTGATQYWLSIMAHGTGTAYEWGWMEAANSEQNAPASVQDFKGSGWVTISNNLYDSDMSFILEDPVPEPGTFASLATGLVGMLGFASGIRRRR